MKDKQAYFQTSDGDLVAYFYTTGQRHDDVEFIDGKYVLFHFIKTPTIEKEADKYYSDSAKVNPRQYAEQLRKIRVLFHTLRRSAAPREVQS